MLKQRVITALILVALLLPTLAVDPVWPFALVMALGIGAAIWEWQMLNGAPFAQALQVSEKPHLPRQHREDADRACLALRSAEQQQAAMP